MKKVTLLCALFFAGWATNVHAQGNDNTDQYFNERGNFAQRLWYGGGFNLGLSGGNNETLFSVGIAPMVGYKLTDELSVGPRLGVHYLYIKTLTYVASPTFANDTDGRLDPNFRSQNFVNWHVGLFTRIKLFKEFFAQLELEITHEDFPDLSTTSIPIYEDGPDKMLTNRVFHENFYGGIGYSSGFPLGFEVMMLYNFNQANDTWLNNDFPISFRAGFNYNF